MDELDKRKYVLRLEELAQASEREQSFMAGSAKQEAVLVLCEIIEQWFGFHGEDIVVAFDKVKSNWH